MRMGRHGQERPIVTSPEVAGEVQEWYHRSECGSGVAGGQMIEPPSNVMELFPISICI